ncbi:hypothetical protein B484DRAFT_414711, partial [Ochromonadaceae sp. CCMP2298]
MAGKLTLMEMAALYSSKGTHPPLIFEPESNDNSGNTAAKLPGTSVAEKVSKLFQKRQQGLLPLRPKHWPSEDPQGQGQQGQGQQGQQGQGQQGQGQCTIAICLVIVDTLHHEQIWRSWIEEGRGEGEEEGQEQGGRLEEGQGGEVGGIREGQGQGDGLFIHAKHPERITSPWVRARCLDLSYRPEWNSVQ